MAARYAVLLFLQLLLQPVFTVMEIAGVVYAIISPPIGGFTVKQLMPSSAPLPRRVLVHYDIICLLKICMNHVRVCIYPKFACSADTTTINLLPALLIIMVIYLKTCATTICTV